MAPIPANLSQGCSTRHTYVILDSCRTSLNFRVFFFKIHATHREERDQREIPLVRKKQDVGGHEIIALRLLPTWGPTVAPSLLENLMGSLARGLDRRGTLDKYLYCWLKA